MSRYTKALDIWQLDDTQRAVLQIGQWVYAGDRDNLGRFYGQGSASTVVAWKGNARAARKGMPGGYFGYMAALRDYGRTVIRR